MLIFADTHYWIAVTDPEDSWHFVAREARDKAGVATLVTTDEVLVEVLNAFSGRGRLFRQTAVDAVYRLRGEGRIIIVEQSRASFDAGLVLYDARNDKGYSLADCISMITMRRMGVEKILTNDRHFTQEGFDVLIRSV